MSNMGHPHFRDIEKSLNNGYSRFQFTCPKCGEKKNPTADLKRAVDNRESHSCRR